MLIKIGLQGYRFLAGAKTCYKLVKTIIEDRNREFYEASAILESTNVYGIQDQMVLKGEAGKLDVNVSVFRNSVEEMDATAIIDRLMHHCTAIAINGDSYRLEEHKLKKNDLPNNLQAAKELKPEWHNCRRQGLSVRGSTYLTVDNDVLFYMFMVYIARENLLASFIFMQGGLGHVISVVRGIGRHIF